MESHQSAAKHKKAELFVTPMESKHPIGDQKEAESVNEKTLTEVSSHLADIEVKIDHLIEHIHDSLYRLKGGREEFQ